jgi:hypothetical protein
METDNRYWTLQDINKRWAHGGKWAIHGGGPGGVKPIIA